MTIPVPLKLVLDSASLITAAKFTVDGLTIMEHLAQRCELVIVPAVHNEVVRAGAVYPDAALVQEMVTSGQIKVQPPAVSGKTVLDNYRLGQGEKESMILALTEPHVDYLHVDYLVVDDRLAFVVSDRITIPKILLIDLLVELVWKESMPLELTEKILKVIEPRYAPGFIPHTVKILEGGDRRCLI